ncbi:MAG: HEPN domain-containing protein [Candidatus Aenigmatarchaeota archaeon]
MRKLDWCKNKKKGIEITEPSKNLAKSYMKKSENSLKTMNSTPAEDWKVTTAYYTCYQALYALLQRTGINSEIHDCTIELMRFFDFDEEDINFIKGLKEKRIDAQYYVTKEVKLEDENKVKDFRLKCKELLEETNFDEVRNEIVSRLE